MPDIRDHHESMLRHLRRANLIAKSAVENGHHPFGAVIVGPGQDIICEQANVDTVDHAEAVAIRRVWHMLKPEELCLCTLYSTVEPCAMCAATLYWANIGRVVFGISEEDLRSVTGDDPRNPTLKLPCAQVISSGSKNIDIIGPIPELRDEIRSLHIEFWKHR